MYPLFLTSMLTWTMLIHLESFIKIILQLSKDLHASQALSIWQSPWHLQPLSQRSILSSWIISQNPHLNSSIVSHTPQRRHIGWTGHFKFYLHLGPQFCKLCPHFLYKGSLCHYYCQATVSEVKLFSNTSWFSTSLPCSICTCILHQHHSELLNSDFQTSRNTLVLFWKLYTLLY